ncbi:hypothetical protein ABIB25_000015 [Nakamurella sp. UYEF19]|uniref:DUF4352 domain-containing protein n=1 Tax=Nakamurella sp. UYEF19 TaxID=1756392 RepID=UPI003399F63C
MHQYESGGIPPPHHRHSVKEREMVIQSPSSDIQPPLIDREVKARIAAEKAYAKSRRSWLARHKVLTVALAAVVFGVAISIATMSGKSASDARTTGSTTSAGAAGIGTAVRDGKFEFTVTAVDAGVATIGTAPLDETAKGQFVTVHLTVKNIGTVAQTFDQSSQTMIDQQGRKLSSDLMAGVSIDPNNFLAGINPGVGVTGVVLFDIAKDAVSTQMELHDSAFSGGVTVQLVK